MTERRRSNPGTPLRHAARGHSARDVLPRPYSPPDIWAVVQGTAPEVYLDAEEFFRKTYLTAGLSTVIQRVARRVERRGRDWGPHHQSADRVRRRQDAHPGGPLASGATRGIGSRTRPTPQSLRKAVGGRLPEETKGVAVFTNQTCDATQGRKIADGVHLAHLVG